ncbi:MAG: radical SAM protein [Thermoanaerobaculia bacterium]
MTVDALETFDEEFYLRTYPDVAAAVASGALGSGRDHYLRFGKDEGRIPLRSLEDLLGSPRTGMVFIEFTSRCNLRCVYCPVSQPTYHGIDLPRESFDNFLEQLRRRNVHTVVMNGHGESMIVKGWEVYADRLTDAGFRLHITTNLAKRLTPFEVVTLSRFERILVSIDTADAELLATLRRGANLETIFANIAAIREFASARRRTPQIAISCTVGDLAAPGIADLVDACLERGITTFRFGDLAEFEPIEGVVRTRHVSHLSPEMLDLVRSRFRLALGKIDSAGGSADVDEPLRSLLVDHHGSDVVASDRRTDISEKKVRYVTPSSTQTRDCLDPWSLAFVQADAAVRPCCFFEEKLGTLATNTLEEIVEGDEFRTLRREIVTGSLRPTCRSCSARPLIDRGEFERKLSRWIDDQTA